MAYKKRRNSMHRIRYRVAWCTKHRKPVLVNQVAEDMQRLLTQIAKDNDFTMDMKIMPDYIDLFITATPNHLVADMVKALKGVSARFLFKEHPELKKQLWGGHLWNPHYFASTVGDVSEETIRKYIQEQKNK